MPPLEPRSETALRTLGNTLVALAVLAFAAPALAGPQGGNLPVQLLELELGGPDRFVLCDDADASGQCETAEEEFVQNITTGQGKKGCELGLVGDPLVELTSSAGPPGIDANKGAIGDRDNKGTGCGRIEEDDVLNIQFLELGVIESFVQFEAKQSVAFEIIFERDGVEVGKRYVLSGTAVAPPDFPSAGSPDLFHCNFGSPDGNPDSGERDDCRLHLSRAGGTAAGAPNPEPFHNKQSYRIRNGGELSLKGGSEFPFPEKNRSAWIVVEYDGILKCGDPFSCAGNPDCINDDGVSGNRTDEQTGDACTNPLPYKLNYDGGEVTFLFTDVNDQDPAFTFDVQWQREATGRDPAAFLGVQFPLDPTVLSYHPDGVACGNGSCSNDATSCQSNSDCAPGNTCVLPVTESCIPLTLCVGTPIRRCSNNDSLGCQEDTDCGSGNTCKLEDLVAPAGGFPDLVAASSATIEYGCLCEHKELYLGPGVCDELSGDLAGTSCEDDLGCGTGGTCELFGRCDDASGALAGDSCGDNTECIDGANEGDCVLGDEVAVAECLFFTGDAKFRRGAKSF
jgi:hypothetical protein